MSVWGSAWGSAWLGWYEEPPPPEPLPPGTPLDLTIWRQFQRRTPNLVERTLALNPGLADLGLLVPIGVGVVIPVDAPNSAPEQRAAVRLWD